MSLDDSIPSMFKEDLHRYQLQNTNAITTLTKVQSQLNLLNQGVSPEDAGWFSDLLAAMSGGLIGNGGGSKTGPKVPPKLEPFTNPPQGPVIPSNWVSRPGRTTGSIIYYPPGTDPSAPGSTYIRVMPSGSTPVTGLENGYWISVKNGQPINPATGGTGTRGDTHVPLPPNTVPPTR
jgi:filamentous hemagglutinin